MGIISFYNFAPTPLSALNLLNEGKYKASIGDAFMTEEQVKLLCKIVVENRNKQFTKEQKEILKQAIDQAKTPQQLFEIAFASNLFEKMI